MFSSFSGSFKFGRRGEVGLPSPVFFLDAEDYVGSGTTWDASVGPNGTLVNSPTYVSTGPVYFDFDGVNQYVEMLHNSVLKPTAEITMEGTVR